MLLVIKYVLINTVTCSTPLFLGKKKQLKSVNMALRIRHVILEILPSRTLSLSSKCIIIIK